MITYSEVIGIKDSQNSDATRWHQNSNVYPSSKM